MKMLFVSAIASNRPDAYNQRLLNLKEGLRYCGVSTEMLYLGDYFFSSPTLVQALDIPMIKKEVEGYDAIHGGSSACYALGLMKNLHNFTLIHDIHGCREDVLLQRGRFDLVGSFSYLQGFILQEISNRSADFFVTSSKPLKIRLVRRGIDRNRIEIVRNGVDTELFKPKDLSLGGKEFVVTYAGGFQKWQGIELLVAAARLVKETAVKFKIIGFGKQDIALKNELNRILAGRTELVDLLSKGELVNQLCLSDILIIPRSRNIVTQMAFPTKFAEYIATGKPVIITDVDETASFVREHNCGFVCEPDAGSVARTIIEAKKQPSDVLAAMGQNGRRLAELKFDRRIIARQYFEFLHRVLPIS